MGKKRAKDKSSREDEDFDLMGPSCRHIKKGADQTLLKKLNGTSDWTSCQDCKPEENKENDSTALPQDSEEGKETVAIWMCLKCGHRGCGRHSENQHAIKHYETPRSDPHCLVVSMDNWSVWCYICDDEVQYSKTGHMAQLVTNLKKQTSADPITIPQKIVKEEDIVLEVAQETETVSTEESEDKENKENKQHQKKNTKNESNGKKSSTTEDKVGVPVKGLSNLGNTCFFNAVIQNLSQTQLLRQTLNKVTEEKISVDIEPAASSELEPVAVQLDQPGSLTVAMCQLLNEIQESKKGVVTPRELFTQVCKKAARFKGFQQQDSQELLRYLLDGMRAEEIKRVSSGIMEALKQSRKSTDGEQLKTLVKEYEKNGLTKNFVDHVFGGEMTSTIMCQQCKTVSVVTEMFLDLSLPVSDEAYRKKNQKKVVQKTSESSQDGRNSPALTNGEDDDTSGSGSKYQQKKAKKQAKKQAKHQKRQQKFDGRFTLDSIASPSHAEEEQTDPAADANEGEHVDSEMHEEAPLSDGNPVEPGGQTPDTVQPAREKEEGEDSETDCDSSATSSVSNRFTVLSKEPNSKDSVLDDEDISDLAQEAEEDAQLVGEMEKVTLDDAFIEDSDAPEQGPETEDEPLEIKEYTVVNQDPELAFHTLATRAAPEKQECSVQSCLFQFTEVETLTQNNSLLCVTCTKRQGNKDKAGGSKKNVYTDALKQMLISSPPPVLTLHLKRFQQNGYSICKVNRHVQFPLILDLAPFCVVKCKNMSEGDAQILYSLYGIVEHSGTMRSGHYTAYVKARPDCPKPMSNGLAAGGDAEPPKGSWFHVSDTSVQPVSENKVQSCQAYLLFYERIL
ncbi:putative ubiquitin carboxyl-terminal hydrolase 16 isoform 2 [Scophthalmus maximus]|uniref:Ubiquitin carboxyl-terminal hydrolase 16 n=1 Tax=Scophthalmus maximus TaxID=52904 RepID=A0A2U9B411_SCOMX|nr:putative ubiquitin carboxyl-terminal hydrolase 16 [Scophthalmus maximus]AWO98704.1 putative ubiquitin carboxyl-terminal hydrolase 16 isoform 2 [Scophthalmus maximus]